MPTISIIGPYRFFFYASDRDESQHIHVERNDKVAKFWLDPIRLQSSGGFNRLEIGRIQKIIDEYQTQLKEAWNDYFGS
ncbi:DUF4160 domain-containing protein [Thermodesulfovibrionales bacterium]|nr:DUF4160 domain-containing protein [Thermodesulfovibrionales bacterium]